LGVEPGTGLGLPLGTDPEIAESPDGIGRRRLASSTGSCHAQNFTLNAHIT
jgi:hypothetical protein